MISSRTRALLACAALSITSAAWSQQPERFLTDSHDYSLCDVWLVGQTLEGGSEASRAFFETRLEAQDTSALEAALEVARQTGARCDFATSGYLPDDAALLAEHWGVSALEARTRVEEAITRGETPAIELALDAARFEPMAAEAPERLPGPCSEATYCVSGCEATAESFDEIRYIYDRRERLMMIRYPNEITRLIYDGDAARPTRIESSDGSAYDLSYEPAIGMPALPWSEEEHALDSPMRYRPSELRSDEDSDGAPELTWTFRYDAEGHVLGEEIVARDGTRHSITHALNPRGEYTLWSDHTYPDADEVCVTHPYIRRHPTGQIALARRFSSLCDPDLLARYQYDTSGNLRAVIIDDGADGLPDYITTYGYTCWQSP